MKNRLQVPKMNAIVMFPAIITCLLVTFGVNSSKPKTPPTLSAAVTQTDFLTGTVMPEALF